MASGPDVFRPYLIRAVYDWCLDNGNTPHVVARAGDSGVPAGMADENGVVVLNVGPAAVRDLKIDASHIVFTARFAGVVRNVRLPCADVLVVYGRESGHKLSFLAPATDGMREAETSAEPGRGSRKKGGRAPDLEVY